MEVDEIDRTLKSLLVDVVVDLDSQSLQVVRKSLELSLGDVFLSDEREHSVGFQLSPGAGAVVGVEFAESDLPALLEELSLVFLGDALEVIFLHFSLAEREIEVDVEGAYEDLLDEIGLIVEGACAFVVDELDLDDAVLAVDGELLGLALLLAVLEEHVDHLVLDRLLHPLDYHLLALPHLLLHALLHLLKYIKQHTHTHLYNPTHTLISHSFNPIVALLLRWQLGVD